MRELRGEPCLEMNECVPTKQQIICSRSFGHRITEYRDMQTIDKLNVSGRGTIWFAGQGIQKKLGDETGNALSGLYDTIRRFARGEIIISAQETRQ